MSLLLPPTWLVYAPHFDRRHKSINSNCPFPSFIRSFVCKLRFNWIHTQNFAPFLLPFARNPPAAFCQVFQTNVQFGFLSAIVSEWSHYVANYEMKSFWAPLGPFDELNLSCLINSAKRVLKFVVVQLNTLSSFSLFPQNWIQYIRFFQFCFPCTPEQCHLDEIQKWKWFVADLFQFQTEFLSPFPSLRLILSSCLPSYFHSSSVCSQPSNRWYGDARPKSVKSGFWKSCRQVQTLVLWFVCVCVVLR